MPCKYPANTPPVPRQYPEYPVVPTLYPPTILDLVRPRTSVGARPHVLEVDFGVAAVASAADDIDGAGGVDHRRVPPSVSPRRAGRAARPAHTCGQRARTDR